MNRKFLLTSIFVVVYLVSSCSGTKNKINDENTRDSMGVDLSIKLQMGKIFKYNHSKQESIKALQE